MVGECSDFSIYAASAPKKLRTFTRWVFSVNPQIGILLFLFEEEIEVEVDNGVIFMDDDCRQFCQHIGMHLGDQSTSYKRKNKSYDGFL